MNPADADSLRRLVRAAGAVEMPTVTRMREDAAANADRIEIGRSAFLQQQGYTSELDCKRAAMRDGRITWHAHIGMNDIDATATALEQIHRELSARGYQLDRAGVALDRRMGLPPERRAQAAAETGPLLATVDDWRQLAQAAPIQPHMGDFMIGQPASLENTVQALRIGCTTIGNLSQYFTFEAPGWADPATTARVTAESVFLLGAFREQGVMLHSYLEDGNGALFRYCATVAAWAMLERYIVEELIGARLSHCIGGLTSDPLRRAGWVLALQQIHHGDHVGSMIYGDTISFGPEFEINRALTAEYLTWDILAQLHAPSGHAVLPLPVTEAIRIPSAEEIIEAQVFGRRIEDSARRLYPHVDFTPAQAFADRVYAQGRRIFDNALQGLRDCGADLQNPARLLYLLKQIGAQNFENWFVDDDAVREEVTDIYALAQDVVEAHRPLFAEPDLRARVQGKRFVVASSDVHEHAAGALAQLLGEAGATVEYLGAEQSPADLVTALASCDADALLLSTHNGMALDYARQLRELLQREALTLPVVMGGVLNQKVDDRELPVPVIEELRALGMRPAISLPGLVKLLPAD